jgi:hypothetical protein
MITLFVLPLHFKTKTMKKSILEKKKIPVLYRRTAVRLSRLLLRQPSRTAVHLLLRSSSFSLLAFKSFLPYAVIPQDTL